MYRKISDGVSFRWGRKEKLQRSDDWIPCNPLNSCKNPEFTVLVKLSSNESLENIPEEIVEDSKDAEKIHNRDLVQRDFDTLKHREFFQSGPIASMKSMSDGKLKKKNKK